MNVNEIISEVRITVNGNTTSAWFRAESEAVAALAVQMIKAANILRPTHYAFAVHGKVFIRRKF